MTFPFAPFAQSDSAVVFSLDPVPSLPHSKLMNLQFKKTFSETDLELAAVLCEAEESGFADGYPLP